MLVFIHIFLHMLKSILWHLKSLFAPFHSVQAVFFSELDSSEIRANMVTEVFTVQLVSQTLFSYL